MLKNYFSPLLILALFSSFSFGPGRAEAQVSVGVPFGGLVTTVIPCTCPATLGNFWISYTPMFFGSVPAFGALVYSPLTSKVHELYKPIIPSTWHLGTYVPGVQACWMIAPPPVGCFPLPSAGLITSIGTS